MTPAERALALASLLEGTGIGLLELTTPDGTLRLRRDCGPATARPGPEPQGLTVPSPSPGVFRTAHPSFDAILATPGRLVAAGEAVGLVQAGALLLHVIAPVSGTVQTVLAADGDLVGFGTPLLLLMEARG